MPRLLHHISARYLPWDSLSLFVSASKSRVNGFPRSERPILDP